MNLKRIVSLLVVFTLVFSFASIVNVQAAEEAFPILKTLGFTTDFSDDTTPITRYQLAEVAMQLANLQPEPEGTPVYPDVPVRHRYFPVVNAVSSAGYMGAKMDGSFGPDDIATVMDGGRILLSELGYSAFAVQAGWTDAQYNSKVQQLGLMRGISASEGLTYYDFGKMIINMLDKKTMEILSIDSDGIKFKESDLSYVESKYGYVIKTGLLQANGEASIASYAATTPITAVIDGVTYKTDGQDYSKYVGYSVKYILTSKYEDGRIIHVEKYIGTEEIVIQAENLLSAYNRTITYVDENGKTDTATFGTGARVIVNGQNMSGSSMANLDKYLNLDHGYITLVDTTDDNVYDVVNINTMVYFKVGGRTSYSLSDQFIADASGIIRADQIKTYVTKNGAPSDIMQFDSGSYVEVGAGEVKFETHNRNEIMRIDLAKSERVTINGVNTTTVSGKVYAKRVDAIGIDGVVYKFNKYYSDLLACGFVDAVAIGDTVDLVLNEKGEVIDIPNVVSSYTENAANQIYGYMLNMTALDPLSGRAVIRMIDIYEVDDVRLTTSADCKFNGKKFKFSELNAVDPTTTGTALYYPNGTFKQQIIKYALNEAGEICEFYIAKDRTNQYIVADVEGNLSTYRNPDYDPQYLGYDSNNFTLDFMKATYGLGANINFLYNTTKQDTISLQVPADPTDLRTWTIYINVEPSDKEGSVATAPLSADAPKMLSIYDSSNTYVPSVVLARGAGAGNRSSIENRFDDIDRTLFVTDIMTVYDEVKEIPRTQITAQRVTTSGVETIKYVIEDESYASNWHIHNPRTLTNVPSVLWKDIRIGDTLRVKLNTLGEVSGFGRPILKEDIDDLDTVVCGEILYTGTGRTDGSGNPELRRGYYTHYDIGYVTTVFTDGSGAMMNLAGENGGPEDLFRITIPNPVAGGTNSAVGAMAIYHTDSNTLETATMLDISVGDKVLTRSNNGEVCEVFIIRK